MDLQEIKTKLAATKKQIEELRAQAAEEGKKAFSEACQSLFERHEKLIAFGWTQYTPYFCDGEPCEFSVNEELMFELAGVPEGADWIEESYSGHGLCELVTYNASPIPDEYAAIDREVGEVFDLLDQDMCEDLFGDHVLVKVTRDGVETHEYEHD